MKKNLLPLAATLIVVFPFLRMRFAAENRLRIQLGRVHQPGRPFHVRAGDRHSCGLHDVRYPTRKCTQSSERALSDLRRAHPLGLHDRAHVRPKDLLHRSTGRTFPMPPS